MRIIVAILTTMLFVVFPVAGVAQQYKIPPRDGFWWDPSAPGRGWNIEVQDNVVAITHYAYDESGNPLFYTTAGLWNPSTGTLSGDAIINSAGPCIGCVYSPPQAAVAGTVVFEFSSTETGVIRYSNGTNIPIRRFYFGYGATPDEHLPGWWHSSLGALGVYFGDFLSITGRCMSCSDTSFYQGSRVDGGSSRILLARSLPSDPNKILLLLDSSTSYYQQYLFVSDLNEWVGKAWTYTKGDTPPTTGGLDMFASRIQGPQIASGLGISKKLDSMVRDELDAASALLSAETGDAKLVLVSGHKVDRAELSVVAEALQAEMERLRN